MQFIIICIALLVVMFICLVGVTMVKGRRFAEKAAEVVFLYENRENIKNRTSLSSGNSDTKIKAVEVENTGHFVRVGKTGIPANRLDDYILIHAENAMEEYNKLPMILKQDSEGVKMKIQIEWIIEKIKAEKKLRA